ncbi:MAG: bifunctional diguanylate cyclase/phosphodiesterase [Kineosporiaceae bacterium]|nr:bifunctional diguanylate cyclase/phosphodiesterase [Kineosporiaceae bacterium]
MVTERLTQLADRQALSDALADETTAAHSPDPSRDGLGGGDGLGGWTNRIGLLLVDVDRFREIAAEVGPDGGEEVLATLATRMRPALRSNQSLVRLGGDEFAVVLPDADREVAERVAHALLAQLEEPIEVDSGGVRRRLKVAASVGVATCRLPREDPSALVQQASVAVWRAKQSGGGVSHFELGAEQPSRQPPIGELRVALEQGDLEVYLQPQVRLAGGAICGAEALARWRHPQDGVLLPASFLPLAAQTGLMRPIAATVIELALRACARWWSQGLEVPVSVNLGASDLMDDGFTDRIPHLLAAHDLPARALRIEITEDVFLSDRSTVAELIDRWRSAGMMVALDDFGTGYSSLAYLRELAIDELKLDRVFVTDLARATTATIVRHTIAMGHGLGVQVVAEGIEDAATAEALAQMGCDIGQGLHFGAAMPLEDFLRRLHQDGDGR